MMGAGKPDLRQFSSTLSRGRSFWVEGFWLLVQALFVRSWLPGSTHRRWLLRWFGAQIGKGVVIKPGVRVKFPWRLTVGDYSWIGEGVWIDNLAPVEIGKHCCISQEAYLCTGSHDWSAPGFDLILKPIVLKDGVWVAARAVVGPGVTLEEGAVLALGSLATKDLERWGVFLGVPAKRIKERCISEVQEPGSCGRNT